MDCCSKTLFKVSSKFKVQMFKGIHILGLHPGAVAGGKRGKWFSSGSDVPVGRHPVHTPVGSVCCCKWKLWVKGPRMVGSTAQSWGAWWKGIRHRQILPGLLGS